MVINEFTEKLKFISQSQMTQTHIEITVGKLK